MISEQTDHARKKHSIAVIFSTTLKDYQTYGIHDREDNDVYYPHNQDTNKIIDKFTQYLSIKILIWAEYYSSGSTNEPAH